MIKLKDEGIGQWPHFSVILVLVLDKSSKCYKEETETDEIRSFKKRLEEEIPEFECVAIIRGVLVLHYSSSFPMSTKEMKKKSQKWQGKFSTKTGLLIESTKQTNGLYTITTQPLVCPSL